MYALDKMLMEWIKDRRGINTIKWEVAINHFPFVTCFEAHPLYSFCIVDMRTLTPKTGKPSPLKIPEKRVMSKQKVIIGKR
jgi:hypothetical protein